MQRLDFYIPEDKLTFLKKNSSISVSEHIRRAIDEYIKKFEVKAVTSPTKTYGTE